MSNPYSMDNVDTQNISVASENGVAANGGGQGADVQQNLDNDATTHFGFKTVREGEKQGMVRDVFDSVASKYDLMNDLMSAGVHRIWKNHMVTWLNPRPGMHVVDVAGGTGDIALRILQQSQKRAKSRGGAASAHVSICDINYEMLAVGADRAFDKGVFGEIDWVCGNAECLPFPDASLDAYTCAFGLRNVTRLDVALQEARRVLKPGGRFLCLEFSHVTLPLLDRLYDTYSFSVLPKLGQLVAGDADSYQYLAESIRQFPNQDAYVQRIAQAGLRNVEYRNLSGGIAALHSAWRI
jgi:demethylmenaquinone methyltransferase/2-methoxy-6-polyprenyl-1,4-benzoquinol methylase